MTPQPQPFLLPLPLALLCVILALVGLFYIALAYKSEEIDWVEGGVAAIVCGCVGWAGTEAMIRLIFA
jgi:hypothetical protein